MNVKRKEAAVKKYAPMLQQGVTIEELTDLISKDEKQYTSDEITEITAAINDPAAYSPAKPKQKEETKEEVENEYFEEWRCEIKIETNGDGKVTDRKAEKVKRLRPRVVITEEEAETLNTGALHSPRQDYVVMYFKPE